jgi:ABC-type multidrug transport system fused ATPase/permease subunit
MKKFNFKKILKKILFLLLFSILYLAIGYVAAILISNQFHYKLQDVMFMVGFLLFIIGILMSMKGNPSGTSFSGIGQKNVNAISNLDLEITRMEREIKPYHKDYYKNNVVEFAFDNLTFLLGGVLIIISSIIFF